MFVIPEELNEGQRETIQIALGQGFEFREDGYGYFTWVIPHSMDIGDFAIMQERMTRLFLHIMLRTLDTNELTYSVRYR